MYLLMIIIGVLIFIFGVKRLPDRGKNTEQHNQELELNNGGLSDVNNSVNAKDTQIKERSGEEELGGTGMVGKLLLLFVSIFSITIVVTISILSPDEDLEKEPTYAGTARKANNEHIPQSTANEKISSTSMQMEFSECLSLIDQTSGQMNVIPSVRLDTDIVKMVDLHTSDGKVIITCSKLDQKMVITKSLD